MAQKAVGVVSANDGDFDPPQHVARLEFADGGFVEFAAVIYHDDERESPAQSPPLDDVL